jgi:hypothetical protein
MMGSEKGPFKAERTMGRAKPMSEPILTPAEWAMPLEDFCFGVAFTAGSGEPGAVEVSRLKLAARWLHEAGYFTREHVAGLENLVDDRTWEESKRSGGEESAELKAARELLWLLKDLLPPESAGTVGGTV